MAADAQKSGGRQSVGVGGISADAPAWRRHAAAPSRAENELSSRPTRLVTTNFPMTLNQFMGHYSTASIGGTDLLSVVHQRLC